jgi:hypothetical protein
MVRMAALARTLLAGSLALSFNALEAAAQRGAVRVWDVPLGTPVAELPPDFMIKACGTNGGPPSIQIESFQEFARCRPEPGTGLYEVWFSYDDEAEYYQRAFRASPILIATNRANNLFDQLVVFSLLIDEAGLVQGHRIVTDSREDPERRIQADSIVLPLKIAYGLQGWVCTDLPRLPGEMPLGGEYLKQRCEKTADGRFVTIETHRFLRPGQRTGPGAPLASEFEVWVRVEVISADLASRAQ